MLILLNRNPEPGEAIVPRDADIYLEIHSTGADNISNAATQVYVDSVLAYSAGTFQPGFDGPDSATAQPEVGIRTIRIDLASDFASEQIVNVRVVSATTPSADPIALLDESYPFTVEDFTAPQVVNAFAIDVRTIRIEFNETMRADDASDEDDATNPANYSIVRNNIDPVAAVNPAVVSVTQVSPTKFDVVTDIEMTFGVQYTITTLNAEDTIGNAIAAPLNVATFVAFTPPPPDGRAFDIYHDLLPAKARRDDKTKDLFRFISVLQDTLNVLLYDVDRWTQIIDHRVAPEQFIDAILYGLGNPFTFTLSLADKRRLASVLVQMYRRKGLAEGIEEVVLFFLGLVVEVRPCLAGDGWILGESELGEDTILGSGDQALLYSFEIESLIPLTDDQRRAIAVIANYMKPAHTHLKEIIEPEIPIVVDHWELGLSELGETTILH